jgi:uncharacterized membrane protein
MEEHKDTSVNTLKVGHFQLQTKSFWISLVSILVLFLLAMNWMTNSYWYRICNNLIELNKTIKIYQ